MRVLIMAAGVATRYRNVSKAYLEIEGETIVERMIGQLSRYGLGPVYIVIGHEAERFLTLRGVALIPNPDYLTGDNAQGLRVALDVIGFEDTLILDGDLVLSPDALWPLIETYAKYGESVSLVDLSLVDPEAVKLVIEGDRIVEYSKDRGVGAEICTLVTADVLRGIYSELDGLKWWGVGVSDGKLCPRIAPLADGQQWAEIDTPEDHAAANRMFAE